MELELTHADVEEIMGRSADDCDIVWGLPLVMRLCRDHLALEAEVERLRTGGEAMKQPAAIELWNALLWHGSERTRFGVALLTHGVGGSLSDVPSDYDAPQRAAAASWLRAWADAIEGK